jgi:prepilin peptidase CpaA
MENIILLVVLLISVITDVKSRKILNIVTLPSILIGVIYYTTTSGLDGLLFSGKGFIVGLVLLFIPFLLGGIGAGDVKLLAAIGALKGTTFVFYSFLYAGAIGFFIALFIIIKQKHFGGLLFRLFNATLQREVGSLNLEKKDLAPSFPYGVAIALGVLCAYLLEGKL